MKKTLLFLTALLSVFFLHAQNNEKPLANEEFFKQATLVFEGSFWKTVDAYNLMGNTNYDDNYCISVYRVKKVYKGNQSLTGDVVYVVNKGCDPNAADPKWENFADPGGAMPLVLYEKGIPHVNQGAPSIFFMINSDYPDDENSKYLHEKKYKHIKPSVFGQLYVWENITAGLNDLDFQNREDLYNYMKQFEGYVVPEPATQNKKQAEAETNATNH